MISGHIATTLIAKRIVPKAPWWLLVLASYGNDLLMFALVLFGIERFEADLAKGGMEAAIIDMTYSHDLLPTLVWTALFGAAVWLIARNRKLALVCAALFFGHFVCDLFSGFGHFVFGPDSHPIGTDLYHGDLLTALIIESVFSVVCVTLATVKTDASRTKRALLYLGFGLMPFTSLAF